MPECTHLNQIRKVSPHTKGCEECLKMGDTWVHLRLCLECHQTPHHEINRAKRDLGLVLHRRSRVGLRVTPQQVGVQKRRSAKKHPTEKN
jgi:hypothetical protein